MGYAADSYYAHVLETRRREERAADPCKVAARLSLRPLCTHGMLAPKAATWVHGTRKGPRTKSQVPPADACLTVLTVSGGVATASTLSGGVRIVTTWEGRTTGHVDGPVSVALTWADVEGLRRRHADGCIMHDTDTDTWSVAGAGIDAPAYTGPMGDYEAECAAMDMDVAGAAPVRMDTLPELWTLAADVVRDMRAAGYTVVRSDTAQGAAYAHTIVTGDTWSVQIDMATTEPMDAWEDPAPSVDPAPAPVVEREEPGPVVVEWDGDATATSWEVRGEERAALYPDRQLYLVWATDGTRHVCEVRRYRKADNAREWGERYAQNSLMRGATSWGVVQGTDPALIAI